MVEQLLDGLPAGPIMAKVPRIIKVPAGEAYVDVGTLHGYREAIHVLEERPAAGADVLPAGRALLT